MNASWRGRVKRTRQGATRHLQPVVALHDRVEVRPEPLQHHGRGGWPAGRGRRRRAEARPRDLGDRIPSRPDWIAGLPLDEYGLPLTRRGAVESMPGLSFVGMPFRYALTSALPGGVGRDAEYVVGRILRTP